MLPAVAPALILALVVGGCVLGRDKGVASRNPLKPLPAGSRLDVSQEAYSQAQTHFRNEDYGLAEVYYRKAIEVNPNNGDAWIGLAASYDRLKRFDLAERAYRVVVKKVAIPSPCTTISAITIICGARRRRRASISMPPMPMDPDNPYVLNNLKLVEPFLAALRYPLFQ